MTLFKRTVVAPSEKSSYRSSADPVLPFSVAVERTLLKIIRIDHVALAVPDLDPACAGWMKVLGLLPGVREYVPTQLTDAAFLLTSAEAEACVELIAPRPRGQNAGLEKFLDRRGGLHHIAFAVEDLAGALRELQEQGVPLIDTAPRPGARCHQVAFLHPKALGGVLVELVSAGP